MAESMKDYEKELEESMKTELGVTLSDSDKSTLIQLYNKFKNMDLDENELRSQVNKVYDKLESLGITKEDVKGILGKLVELVKGFLN